VDWFEKLTGFREAGYDDTRVKLAVEGDQLKSLVNGKSYRIGDLELVSLQALRERVASAGALPGRLKVSVVTGDVRHMHKFPKIRRGFVPSRLPVQPSGNDWTRDNTGAGRYSLPK
jgi:hypothetical protein